MGLAIVRPRAALAVAGDRKHAGRSGTDLLVAFIVLIIATQLRAIVGAVWLGVAVDGTLGVRALVRTLSDTLVVDLGFLVISSAIIYVASGKGRELGRAFDFGCVAVLPLLFVDLAASVVVYAAELTVPRAVMWALSLTSYVWTGALVGLACVQARRATEAGEPPRARRAGWGLVALALAGLVVQVVWIARHMSNVRPMKSGEAAPMFALPKITGPKTLGERVTLERGKVYVIDFWATWCNPCLKAMPRIDALARAHPDLGVLAINIDDSEEAWTLFSERNYAMTLLAGDRETSERYGVFEIPHTVLIDREGIVRRVYRGGTHDLEREVSALLK